MILNDVQIFLLTMEKFHSASLFHFLINGSFFKINILSVKVSSIFYFKKSYILPNIYYLLINKIKV